jgi:predicted DsbA family dithiol-disulfide isomerase
VYEAKQVGVRGVPFFVFNRKYAVSGAQESQLFLQTLEKSFTEFQKS